MKLASILVFTLLLLTPACVWGDYIPPTFDEVANSCTAIVDATVVELMTREVPLEKGSYKRQEARIEIHRHIFGEKAPTTLTGVSLSCIDGGELHLILKPKTRYIFCLTGSQLLEGNTCYEVREVDGKTICHYRDARAPKEAVWLTMAEFEDKLRAAQEPITTAIGAVTQLKDPGQRLPISMELRTWVAMEIVARAPAGGVDRSALVREAYEKLGASRSREDWDRGFKELVKLEAWGCLLSCAWHSDHALRLRALSLFERHWDKSWRIRIVRSLLPLADTLRGEPIGGIESAMDKWALQTKISAVMSAQTGVNVGPGDPTQKLEEGVRRWGKWLEEQNPDEA